MYFLPNYKYLASDNVKFVAVNQQKEIIVNDDHWHEEKIIEEIAENNIMVSTGTAPVIAIMPSTIDQYKYKASQITDSYGKSHEILSDDELLKCKY